MPAEGGQARRGFSQRNFAQCISRAQHSAGLRRLGFCSAESLGDSLLYQPQEEPSERGLGSLVAKSPGSGARVCMFKS